MNENESPLASLLERAEDYGKTTIELLKLHAIDKSADVISTLVARVAFFLVITLFIIIINIGIALWIGKLLGENFYGFFVVGGFYALIAVLLNAFGHQWIKYPVSNSIIKQLLNKK